MEIPFSSLLSKNRVVNITLQEPNIILPEELLKSGKNSSGSNLPLSINNVNVRKGRFEFIGKKVNIFLLDFNLNSFSLKGKTFYKIDSPHLRIDFPVGKKIVSLEGNLKGEFVRIGKRIRLKKILWETHDIIFTGNGSITPGGIISLRVFWEGTPKNVLYPILKKLSPDGYFNGNLNFIKDEKKDIFILSRFNASSFNTGGEEFNDLNGILRWNNRSKKIRSEMKFRGDGITTTLRLDSKKKVTNIQISDISAKKVIRVVKIRKDVPLGGIIQKSDIRITGRDLKGTFKVIKGEESDDLFNIDGRVDINYNTKSKYVKFESSGLETEFGNIISLYGESVPEEKRLDIKLNSLSSSLDGINVYTKKYASLDLEDWHFRKGTGRIRVEFSKKNGVSILRSHLNIKKLISNKVGIELLKGDIFGKNDTINGKFALEGKNIFGKFGLEKNKQSLNIAITGLEGESKDILKILDIGLDIDGRIKGDFSYKNRKDEIHPLVTGRFKAGNIKFYDFPFSKVSGDIHVLKDTQVKNLRFIYHKGIGNADIRMDTGIEEYEISGKVEKFDISEFIPGLSGNGNLEFKGSGKFFTDPVRVKYSFDNLSFYDEKVMNAVGTAEISTDFSSFKLKSEGEVTYRGLKSPAYLNLDYKESIYNGNFGIEIRDINMIMPWDNNKGKITVNGEIAGSSGTTLQYRGLADANGQFLSFPGFPHTLNDFEGSILFNDTDFSLRSFKGFIGGGKVTGNGRLLIENNSITKLGFELSGRNMELYPMDRADFKLDADLGLRKKGEKYLLEGDLKFLSALWEREVDEGVSFYTGTSLSASNSRFLENLEFDIRMTGERNVRVDNSFFSGDCIVDLRLTGDKNFPILFGTIDSKNGTVHVSSRDFKLIRARVLFNNPVVINPNVNIDAETFIKNYRIRFLLNGVSSDLRPEFLSSPPMPSQDIIALMSLGELFKRPSSTNISSEVGTTGLVTSALTEKIQNRVKKLFGIDILKLDPDPTRSSLEGTSRLTIGKSITKDFLVVYSTDISRATRDVYFFQYNITPSILLIGKRNEDGRLSLDVRFRKRY